jgi:hypothetical protein
MMDSLIIIDSCSILFHNPFNNMNVQSCFILFWGLGLRDNPLGNKATTSLTIAIDASPDGTLVLKDAMDTVVLHRNYDR